MKTSRKIKLLMRININPGMKQMIVLVGLHIKTVNIIIFNIYKKVNVTSR